MEASDNNVECLPSSRIGTRFYGKFMRAASCALHPTNALVGTGILNEFKGLCPEQVCFHLTSQ